MLNLKTRRSGGIPVTKAVHRDISEGNRARDTADWQTAIPAYERALAQDATLHHIWIQLGHVAAELGDWQKAEAAYQAAMSRGAAKSEVSLHLGHLFKRSGDTRGALSFYREAAARGEADALGEVATRVRRLSDIDQATVKRILAAGRLDGFADAPEGVVSTATARALTYDISDVVAHFRHHRSPTGIQRVQIEVIGRAVSAREGATRVCCFVEGMEALVEVPMALFLEIVRLAKSGSSTNDPEWRDAMAELFIGISLSEPMRFSEKEVLVNLGTSWWIYNYFLYIRNLKARYGLTLVAMVYDLIPVYASEHCIRGVAEDYVTWLVGAIQHTDRFFAISESTGRDLRRAAARLGHGEIGDRITVVPLDADFRASADGAATPDFLAAHGLRAGQYAVLVSTIESRKNHILALEVWSELAASGSAALLPQLVFVGRNGWLNDQIFARLAADPELTRRVTVIERASDADLALIYRESKFTIYPSHYEGWGLPVTESLCYGKVPVVADNSSLPEAGGEFAVMFASNSIRAFSDAVLRILRDPQWLVDRERSIVERFKPRSWGAIADQILAAAETAGDTQQSAWQPARVREGKYYPVRLHKSTYLWEGLASGEMFRIGSGWHWPDEAGCRSKEGGGRISFSVSPGTRKVCVYLRLTGLTSAETTYHIGVAGQECAKGVLRAQVTRWSGPIVVTCDAHGLVEIDIRGGAAEALQMREGGSLHARSASIGINGFFVCGERGDFHWRALIDANVAGDIEDLNAYRDTALDVGLSGWHAMDLAS